LFFLQNSFFQECSYVPENFFINFYRPNKKTHSVSASLKKKEQEQGKKNGGLTHGKTGRRQK